MGLQVITSYLLDKVTIHLLFKGGVGETVIT